VTTAKPDHEREQAALDELMRIQFERDAEEWESAMPSEEALTIMEKHIAAKR
jgi:hypothetical protein